mgnify:CR=1 FL=1
MPFFVGGHPGFKCPLDEGESYDDYELRFEQREAAELCTAVPSTGLIDVEHRSKNPMVGHDLPLTHELFDFAETIFDVLESHVVTLTKKTEDKVVTADKQSKKVPDPKQPENTTAYEIDNRQFLSNPDGQQGYGYYVHLSQRRSVIAWSSNSFFRWSGIYSRECDKQPVPRRTGGAVRV